MAAKRLLEDPPPASFSEEDEETEDDAAEEDEENGDSEELEDEQDEDDHQNNKAKSNEDSVTKSLKASQDQSSSESGDESGSETESDDTRPSPTASAFTIKPIASKPMKDSVQPQKNSASKPMKDSVQPQKNSASRKLAVSPVKTVTGSVKRSRESDDVERKESKKNKVSNGQDEDLKRGSGVPRRWSEDDEVAILKGMIEYRSEKGTDPGADMKAFLGFINENCHVDVSMEQLRNKIKRLKQKYQSIAEKGKNGETPVLGKSHDYRLFDLSKKIWEASVTNGMEGSAKKKRKPKPTQSEPKTSASALTNGEINAESARPNSSFYDALLVQGKLLSIPEGAANFMKESLPLMGSAKTRELESKWRELQEDEFKLYLKKVELVRDSAKLMLEAMKASTS